MFWQISGLLLGFLSIFLYAQVLIDVVEKEVLNAPYYIGSVFLGFYAFCTFMVHEVDVAVYMYLGLYIMMILGTLSSHYYENREKD